MMTILLVFMGNMPAYGGNVPTQYAPLYDDTLLTQLATTGNIPSVKFTSFSNNFRILLPPGMRSFFVSMICDNLLVVATVARFGQYPYYTSMPAYLPYGSSFRTENLYGVTGEGSVTIAREGYGYSTMPADKAGWLYVDMKEKSGSGSIREITVNMSVDKAIFAPWYAANKDKLNCACAKNGTCARPDFCWNGGDTCPTPVVPNFNAPSNIIPGQSVTFTDASSNASGWSWSATANTGTSGTANPASYTGTSANKNYTTAFSTAGTYTVKLTAIPTDSNKCSPDSKEMSVTVGKEDVCKTPAVKANFTAPATIKAGQAITFTNTSSPSSAKNWAWTAIDSSGKNIASTNSSNFRVTFPSAGAYAVRLIATDNNDCTSEKLLPLCITK
jgi:plastocyanin